MGSGCSGEEGEDTCEGVLILILRGSRGRNVEQLLTGVETVTSKVKQDKRWTKSLSISSRPAVEATASLSIPLFLSAAVGAAVTAESSLNFLS